MKNTLATWKWSLGVVARSPAVLAALGGLGVIWGLGAYQWLWLPESSGLLLLVALVWGIVQILVAAGFLAGTATSVAEASVTQARRIGLQSLPGFNRRQFARCLGMLAAGGLVVFFLLRILGRSDDYALEVASFLTFHSEKAVSPVDVGKVFDVIKAWIWIVVSGFLLSFLTVVLRGDGREARRQAARLFANCCWRSSFVTSLLSVAVFGGLAYLLATWHPKVPVGFWDYSQALLRLGLTLVLVVVGWLFWMLSLARLNLLPHGKPAL